MANTIAVSGTSVPTVENAVIVNPQEATATHKIVTMPGMVGCEVIPGSILYPVYAMRGEVSGASVAVLNTNIGLLALAVARLCGRSANTVTITFADSSTTLVITNAMMVSGVTKVGTTAKKGTNYTAEVEFAVRRAI